MNKQIFFFFLLIFIIVCSCNKEQPVSAENPIDMGNTSFDVNDHYILKNNVPFIVRGVVYVAGYPGYLP